MVGTLSEVTQNQMFFIIQVLAKSSCWGFYLRHYEQCHAHVRIPLWIGLCGYRLLPIQTAYDRNREVIFIGKEHPVAVHLNSLQQDIFTLWVKWKLKTHLVIPGKQRWSRSFKSQFWQRICFYVWALSHPFFFFSPKFTLLLFPLYKKRRLLVGFPSFPYFALLFFPDSDLVKFNIQKTKQAVQL